MPLVIAMGLGVGRQLHSKDGFGLLALSSVSPICSMLIMEACQRLLHRLRNVRRVRQESGVELA